MITNVVAKWPGSTHDSRILRESTLGDQFERREHNGILLGDSGYPCKTWLLVPFANPNNRPQERYNRSLTRTRSIIECTIGVWKRRFHCLHGEIRLTPQKACRIIAATAVLHNIAKERALPDFQDVIMDRQPDPPRNDHHNMTRERYVAAYFA